MESTDSNSYSRSLPPAASRQQIRTQLIRFNALPRDASILQSKRDEDYTTKRYHATDDMALLMELNRCGWSVARYKQVNPQGDYKDKASFRPYMALYVKGLVPVGEEGQFGIIQSGSKDGTYPLRLSVAFVPLRSEFPMIFGENVRLKHKGTPQTNVIKSFIDDLDAEVAEAQAFVQKMRETTVTREQVTEIALAGIRCRYLDPDLKIDPASMLEGVRWQEDRCCLWDAVKSLHSRLLGEGLLVSTPDKTYASKNIQHIGREFKINFGLFGEIQKLISAQQPQQ